METETCVDNTSSSNINLCLSYLNETTYLNSFFAVFWTFVTLQVGAHKVPNLKKDSHYKNRVLNYTIISTNFELRYSYLLCCSTTNMSEKVRSFHKYFGRILNCQPMSVNRYAFVQQKYKYYRSVELVDRLCRYWTVAKFVSHFRHTRFESDVMLDNRKIAQRRASWISDFVCTDGTFFMRAWSQMLTSTDIQTHRLSERKDPPR